MYSITELIAAFCLGIISYWVYLTMKSSGILRDAWEFLTNPDARKIHHD